MTIQSSSKLITASIFILFFLNSYSQSKNNIDRTRKGVSAKVFLSENDENDNKVVELGNHIQNAIINSEIDTFMSFFDTKSFGNFIVANINEDEKTKQYKSGFLKGIKSSISAIPKRIINEVEAGSYYDFVNYRYENDTKEYRMLFRIYSSETGINYHDYKVSNLDGKLAFNDIYIYLSGEELSKTIRRFYMYSLPKKKLLDFFGKNNTDEFLKMVEAINLYNKGEFKKAYDLLKKIEGEIKLDKYLLIIKSICASNIDDIEYQKSIKAILDAYPNDTSLYLSQIDYYILNKDYDTALSMLEKLQKDTNDDFLDLLKGNLEFERENFDKALEYFKTISDNYINFFDGHSSYLSCLSKMKKFDQSIKFLAFLINEGYQKKDLIEFIDVLDDNGENALEDLAKSELYHNWKKE